MARTADALLAGRAKVALVFPARALAAAPAARRRTSLSNVLTDLPSPVKAMRRVVVPGTMRTSSFLPEKARSLSIEMRALFSRARSPDSIERDPLPDLIETPITRTSSLMIPSEILIVDMSLLLEGACVGAPFQPRKCKLSL